MVLHRPCSREGDVAGVPGLLVVFRDVRRTLISLAGIEEAVVEEASVVDAAPADPNAKYKKGTKLYIEGSLRTRKWQNQQGVDTFTTEVVLNPYSGQMVILSGAKSMGEGATESASTASAPREEVNIEDISQTTMQEYQI